ncbi:hypothetical protein FOXYSP1_07870 [Fusarium oxysporum f. sp. phaseoli]
MTSAIVFPLPALDVLAGACSKPTLEAVSCNQTVRIIESPIPPFIKTLAITHGSCSLS